MMKKTNLFLVLLMALIVMSCSKDETTMSIPQESNAIEFGTYVGRDAQTRAGVNNLTKLQGTGFGVWGYYTNGNNWATTNTPNFMWNQKVTYTDPSWVYTPVKYWPTTKEDKLTFFAYAPYDDQDSATTADNYGIVPSANNIAGTPTITFTIKNNAANMVDLVTANAMNKESSATPAAVDFTFKHVLSRVDFQALALDETLSGNLATETIINITSVKIDAGGEFYKSGKYTLTTSGTDPVVPGVWSDQVFSENALDISTGVFAGVAASHGAKEETKYTDTGVQIASSTVAVPLFNNTAGSEQYLFLIPKDDGLSANALKVTFTYDIVTADINLEKGYSITSATKTVALPAGGLQTGKAYKYTFKFGVDRVVVGTVTVSDWENGTTPEVEIIDYTDTDVTP